MPAPRQPPVIRPVAPTSATPTVIQNKRAPGFRRRRPDRNSIAKRFLRSSDHQTNLYLRCCFLLASPPTAGQEPARGGAGAKPRERFPKTRFRPNGVVGAPRSHRARRRRGIVLPPRWGGHSLGASVSQGFATLHPGLSPRPPLAGLFPPAQMASSPAPPGVEPTASAGHSLSGHFRKVTRPVSRSCMPPTMAISPLRSISRRIGL
jgi:hypothetical protein